MYCPVCGMPVKVNTALCRSCGMSIDLRLYDLEPERKERELRESDVRKNKKYAVLAYWGPFVVLSLLLMKKSDFLKYHANQGLILCIAYLIVLLSFPILKIPLLSWLLLLVIIAFSILGTLNVIKNETLELPVVGKLKIIKFKA